MSSAWIKFKKKEPWPRFFLKVGGLMAVAALIVWAFSSRYALAFDFQKDRCLVGSRLMLIDLKDRVPRRGEIYAFQAPDLSPVFPEGTSMAKVIQALPGDRVRISSDAKIFVNETEVANGFPYAEKLGHTAGDFAREFIIPSNSVLMMGTTVTSFDGRYWGPLQIARLRGRAYQLF